MIPEDYLPPADAFTRDPSRPEAVYRRAIEAGDAFTAIFLVERQRLDDAAGWARARRQALAAMPAAERPADDAEVCILVTGQEHARDNGAWWVKPDGSRRRPGVREPSTCPRCGDAAWVEHLRYHAIPKPHGPGGVWGAFRCDACGERREVVVEPGLSRRYALSPEAAYSDPLLSALAHQGATEEQVIAALTKKLREQQEHSMRLVEFSASPIRYVISKDPGTPVGDGAAPTTGYEYTVKLRGNR